MCQLEKCVTVRKMCHNYKNGSQYLENRSPLEKCVATIKASDTLKHQPTVWPVPYACDISHICHITQAVAAMDSCFGHADEA